MIERRLGLNLILVRHQHRGNDAEAENLLEILADIDGHAIVVGVTRLPALDVA